MRMNVQTMVVGVLALGLLSGCGMTRSSQRPPAPQAIIQAQPAEMLNPNKGSLWNSGGRNTLFADAKARFVGDLITVNVSESSSAKKNAMTELKREADSEVALGGLFGLTEALQKGGLSKLVDSNSTTSNQNHKGEGTTSRDSTFTATITCQVTEVLSNGNLRIEGRRDITVNHENQFIILSGVIRPEDISNTNSVNSAQIADARIDYSGEGVLDDQQQPSWLQQFFTTFHII
ncbi:flagellar L-ring protein [Magnetococcus marinus MC-1]|uniref:Flagellar L-ring protein n=1 Tax=Magnetococcus marinus (strain ATCC BAA-1437 / JCM 17883 / MC-1) TaxID=156889 RepID=A0LC95_MAGMM|nr:flagellar basal body L-ring protein FlgH [Magnetococcus marinus]ABK45588.1 flagellar L-ring protein [Magnetococcus marinus MC-1]